jgi:MFS family permease
LPKKQNNIIIKNETTLKLFLFKKIMKKRKIFYVIYFLAFCTAISDGLVGYIQSSYLSQYIKLNYLSIITTIAAITSLIASFFYPKLVKKFSNYKVGLTLMILATISSFFLFLGPNNFIVILAFIIRFLAFIFILTNFDVILEKSSINAKTGEIRSKYLTIINIAWVMSPMLFNYIIGKNENYNLIYLIGFFILSIALIVFIKNKKNLDVKTNYKTYDLKKTLAEIKSQKSLMVLFSSSILLNFFYCLTVLYTPIYLHEILGISWNYLAIIFTIMLMPFVLIQIPAGLIADKFLGEKEMMITGHLIMIVAVIIIFFANTPNVVFWGIILFFSRIGAALAESMQETYFFKKTDEKNIGLINLFRQSKTIGWLTASALSFIVLLIFDLPYVFILIASVLIINIGFIVLFLKDTK